MTKWNNLSPDTATADEIIKAGKLHGVKEEERCDLSDLLHYVPRTVLFEMLDKDEHTAHFLMSASSMPTKTMIDICNEHAGMKNPREVQAIKDDYEARIKNLRGEADRLNDLLEEAERAAGKTEERLHLAEYEIMTLKARLYDLLIAEKEENANV